MAMKLGLKRKAIGDHETPIINDAVLQLQV